MADKIQTLLVLVPISFTGALVNWICLYGVLKLPVFKNSFGYLSANQALTDALHSTVFLLYYCPMILWDHALLKEYSHICGFILLFCYELSVLTHLLISLNRFFAAWAPITYHKVFHLPQTKCLILVSWLYSLTFSCLFYLRVCHLRFDEKVQFLTFSNSRICIIVGWYGDFIKNSVIVAIIMLLDTVTIMKSRQLIYKLKNSVDAVAARQLLCRDRRFLKQAVIQDTVFMLELLTYFFIPKYFENRWIVFFGTSFAWVGVHGADGIVLIICNPEMRNLIFGWLNVKINNAISAHGTPNQN